MRIGEHLCRFIHLTDQDIEEILHEQKCAHKPFGDVAISLGMCQAADIWRAWCGQQELSPSEVDLDVLGVDAQATTLLPGALAHEHAVLPVRVCGSELIVAAAGECASAHSAVAGHVAGIGLKVKFVTADKTQLLAAIEDYYPTCVDAA